MLAKVLTGDVFYLGQMVVLFVLTFTLPYCALILALMDLGSIYYATKATAFSIVKV